MKKKVGILEDICTCRWSYMLQQILSCLKAEQAHMGYVCLPAMSMFVLAAIKQTLVYSIGILMHYF